MKNFTTLINNLAASTRTNDKVDELIQYFTNAPAEDKIWALALFTGRRLKRSVSPTRLHLWCAEIANIPLWLFEECYQNVGDLSETIALALPEATSQTNYSLSYWMDYLARIAAMEEAEKKTAITNAWMQLGTQERFVFNKLMSASFRIGVSQALVVTALAKIYKVDTQVMTYRISGQWLPQNTDFETLMQGIGTDTDNSKPYPFYLAYPLEDTLEALGNANEWQAEWKWDGIRGQLIKRGSKLYVWSRGEELITDKFPEYKPLLDVLPDGIALDGEIICFSNNNPLPFSILQTRIGRKTISKKILADAPVAFIAYDLLELQGEDIRHRTMQERRALLEQVINAAKQSDDTIPLHLSPTMHFNSWQELIQMQVKAREYVSEGVMLKRKDSIYQAGRRRGDWWKWKVAPLSIDAILVAAQKGHGRRANLYTDYTFAVKGDDGSLVTFAKAYSGLTDKEFKEVDAIIKKNILEKFGPVRTVNPTLVFEIGFEGIAESKRHKSGVAVRFPRMLRWRKDKPAHEINTLTDLKKLLDQYGSAEKSE